MLLIGTDQKEEVNNVPKKEKYDRAVGSITVNSKKIREFYHLNEEAFEDLILSVDQKSTTGKVKFYLVNIARQKSILMAIVIWLKHF